MTVELNKCIFATMLVKPKCVWEAQTPENCKQIIESWKNLPLLLNRILALPTNDQISTVLVLQPFTLDNYQSEHPLVLF